jgi:hypothetical protein
MARDAGGLIWNKVPIAGVFVCVCLRSMLARMESWNVKQLASIRAA